MDDFLLRSLVAGLLIAVIGGALGSFLVWRRMAFFGDTLAHGSLLGVALGLFLGIDLTLGALLSCLVVAALFARLQGKGRRALASDTLLAVIAHGTLAFGIIAVALLAPRRAALESYLIGDLLAVSQREIIIIAMISIGAAAIAAACWRAWVSMAVDEELAWMEGVAVERMRLLQMLVLAALVGSAMRVIGALLVTALMIIPPAAARALARSPEQMACGGALLGSLAVLLGLWASYVFDAPAGPAVVGAACVLFALTHVAAHAR